MFLKYYFVIRLPHGKKRKTKQTLETPGENFSMYMRLYVCSFSRELLRQGRRKLHPRSVSFDAASVEDDSLKVGIIGCGHLGKQLVNVLLRLVPIPAENLHISTRRPESLGEEHRV